MPPSYSEPRTSSREQDWSRRSEAGVVGMLQAPSYEEAVANKSDRTDMKAEYDYRGN